MKKQIRQISKFAAYLAISILIAGTFFSASTPAQNGKRITEQTDVWYLSFIVTVKGKGKIEPEEPGGSTTLWEVNRTYSGTRQLDKGKVFAVGSGKDAAEALKTKRFIRFTNPTDSPTMNIKIDDRINVYNEDDTCGENVKTLETTTWTANVDGWPSNHFDTSLTIDNDKRSHNVSIPVSLAAAGRDLLVIRKVLDIHTTTSDGVESHVQKLLNVQNDSVFNLPIPNISGLIEEGRIRHKDYLPLSFVDGGYEFTSKEETPSQTLLPNIATQPNVKISVYYRLKKFKD